jgi:hypothetical protein
MSELAAFVRRDGSASGAGEEARDEHEDRDLLGQTNGTEALDRREA